MILVDWQIKQLIQDGLTDEKWIPLINSASLDITVGDHAYVLTKQASDVTDRFGNNFISIPIERLVFSSGTRVLIQTQQEFKFPPTVTGQIQLKSTMGRAFYEHVMAGWIDPGYQGIPTLELVNHAYGDLPLRKGDRIAQIIFHSCHKPTNPYNGKYQFDKKVQIAKEEK